MNVVPSRTTGNIIGRAMYTLLTDTNREVYIPITIDGNIELSAHAEKNLRTRSVVRWIVVPEAAYHEPEGNATIVSSLRWPSRLDFFASTFESRFESAVNQARLIVRRNRLLAAVARFQAELSPAELMRWSGYATGLSRQRGVTQDYRDMDYKAIKIWEDEIIARGYGEWGRDEE